MHLLHLVLATHFAFSSNVLHGDEQTTQGEVPRSDKLSRLVSAMQTGSLLRVQMAGGSMVEGTFVQRHDGILDLNSETAGKVSLVMDDVIMLWEYGRDDPKSGLWGLAVGATLGACLGALATREGPAEVRMKFAGGLAAIGGILGALVGGFAGHATKEWHKLYP